jgi:integrase
MGYLRKIEGSPYWQAVFINENNVEVQRSTRTDDRKQADAQLDAWAFAAHLLRQGNLCKHRTRAVVSEMSRLLGGDTTPLITFESYRKGYLALGLASAEIQSYSNRKSGLKAFATYLKEKVMLPLEDIVNPDIIGFRDHLFELGYKAETVKQRIDVLHAFFQAAVTEKVIKHNPVAGVTVKVPKKKGKAKGKKRKALSFDEGVKLVDAASVEELVVVVLGLDLGARIGDAFGVELPLINLQTGHITYWVEKVDEWHTVDLFPGTLPFLTEYVEFHRAKAQSPHLVPTIGVVSGPDVDPKKHRSGVNAALKIIRALVDRAGIGELVTLPSGDVFNTVAFHCFRITNDNALKMAGVSTEWVMWRMCQKDKKANKAYDRFTPDNGKKTIFGMLGIEHKADEAEAPKEEEKTDDGSMTFAEMMAVIEYARQKLVSIRLGHKLQPPMPQMTMFG